jgi:hypothetical protein
MRKPTAQRDALQSRHWLRSTPFCASLLEPRNLSTPAATRWPTLREEGVLAEVDHQQGERCLLTGEPQEDGAV